MKSPNIRLTAFAGSIAFVAFLSISITLTTGRVLANSSVEDVIHQDISGRHADFELINIEKTPWGVYWVSFYTSDFFGDRRKSFSQYSPEGSWLDEKIELIENVPHQVFDVIEAEHMERMTHMTYVNGNDHTPYFFLKSKMGQIILLDEGFQKMKRGPLRNGLQMSQNLRSDLKSRFPESKVIQGWIYDSIINFEVNEKTEAGFILHRVTYDTGHKWISTVNYVNDLNKLPEPILNTLIDHEVSAQDITSMEYCQTSSDGNYYCVFLHNQPPMRFSSEYEWIK